VDSFGVPIPGDEQFSFCDRNRRIKGPSLTRALTGKTVRHPVRIPSRGTRSNIPRNSLQLLHDTLHTPAVNVINASFQFHRLAVRHQPRQSTNPRGSPSPGKSKAALHSRECRGARATVAVCPPPSTEMCPPLRIHFTRIGKKKKKRFLQKNFL